MPALVVKDFPATALDRLAREAAARRESVSDAAARLLLWALGQLDAAPAVAGAANGRPPGPFYETEEELGIIHVPRPADAVRVWARPASGPRLPDPITLEPDLTP